MHRKSALLAALMAVLPMASVALVSDQQQPLQIEADQFQLDRETGVSIYTGHVTLQRGSLRLEAHTLTLHHQGKRLQRMVASGAPARLQQQADSAGQTITATAQEMVYETASGLITLNRDAQLLQDRNRFASQRIVYDTIKARITAGDSGEGQRVQIIIQPDQASPDKSDATPAPAPAPAETP